MAEELGLEGLTDQQPQLFSLSDLARGVVASIDPDCEFVGNSHFSPNMTLMGQSLADWAGTHGDRRKCPSILRSPVPDGAEVFSVKAQLARWAARAHWEKAWSF